MMTAFHWQFKLAFLIMLDPQPPALQAPQGDSIVARTMAVVRRDGTAASAMRLLSQTGGPRSAVALDALADSLVAVALEPVGAGDVRLQAFRGSAISALGEAGSPRAKVPYRGAGERLFRIAQSADDPGMRGVAIFRIGGLADTPTALRLLRRIAVSDNAVAVSAIHRLSGEVLGQGGLAVLRELFTSGAVTQESARNQLEWLARKYGWQ
jgi:hypothetical protein